MVRLKGVIINHLQMLYLFQFQCGAIKSIKTYTNEGELVRFNSNVVRLKENRVRATFNREIGFNSNVVRLKD